MESLGEALARIRPAALTGPTEPPPEDPPACHVCRDAGFVRHNVPVGHADFGRAFPCVCRLSEVRDRLRRRSNLGHLADRSFANFVPEGFSLTAEAARQRLRAALHACVAFADTPVGWLVLGGPAGCGKTHLAAAIANARIERGHEVFFAVVPDLLDHLRATFAPHSDVTYDELFESVRNTPLLVLDDLGTQSASPWAQEKLFQILNHRFNAELPTVVTTNHRLADLDERLRARLDNRRLSLFIEVQEWDSAVATPLLDDWPPGLRDARFEAFQDQGEGFTTKQASSLRAAHNAALEFASNPTGWLVLIGEVGRGKTHLAAAIKNERDKFDQPTLFVTVPDLLDYLRATYAPNSAVTYDRGFDVIRNAPVLILDDYGAHSSTPWAEEKLFQLLNHRFNARLPTVITTNQPIDRPATLVPGQQQELRIFSRLIDPALSKVVRIDAPPYKRPELAARPRQDGERRGSRAPKN